MVFSKLSSVGEWIVELWSSVEEEVASSHVPVQSRGMRETVMRTKTITTIDERRERRYSIGAYNVAKSKRGG